MRTAFEVYGAICLLLLVWALWHTAYNPKAPRLSLRTKIVFVLAVATPMVNFVTLYFVMRSLWRNK